MDFITTIRDCAIELYISEFTVTMAALAFIAWLRK